MTKSYQMIQEIALSLYYYYMNYKRFPNPIVNPDTCDRFTVYLMWLFESQFPWFQFDQPDSSLGRIILFEDPFTDGYDLEDTNIQFYDIMKSLIDFPNANRYIIKDEYCIIQICPIPIDGLEITHGMIVQFFTMMI